MNEDFYEQQKMKLDLILNYDLNELETKAYKCCLMFLERAEKLFPDYKHNYIKTGDPRKSLIFKYCYKLVRETQNTLKDDEYELYIRSQLEVLKHIHTNTNHSILISPNCLVGDKAWKRWKLWKSKYDKLFKKPEELKTNINAINKALDGIKNTKKFYLKTFGNLPSFDTLLIAKQDGRLLTWINIGYISPYYMAISPFIKKLISENELNLINFNPVMYKHCINEEVLQKFNLEFQNEKET